MKNLLVYKKSFLVTIILLILLYIIGTNINYFKRDSIQVIKNIPLVKTSTIKLESETKRYTYSGDVQGIYETPLAFQVSGKIIKRNVDPGSVVHTGDVLLDIDSTDIEPTVNIASAQVDTANSKLKLAESTLSRYRALLQANAISQQAFDQIQDEYNAAEAASRLAQAQYTQSLNQLKYCSLLADRDGVVKAVNVNVGQVVAAGTPAIMLSGEREVKIDVPENQVEAIKQAKTFKVSFWALSGIIVDGKIRQISPSADPITRTYEVEISLINTPSNVKLGMTATVDIKGVNNDKSIYIPLSAVYQTGSTPHVWVLKNEGVTLRAVKLGTYGDNNVEVVEGIKEGDVIVTAGADKLQEGEIVNKAGDSQ